jgi:N-acetylmuramic acid 6-phosphate etherase
MSGQGTEAFSSRFADLESWTSPDLVAAIVEGQFAAIGAVQAASASLAEAIDGAAERLSRGGRLIYMGAGTSGRIAAQDGAELPPTFNWPRERALALMAGGKEAFLNAVEGAEDREDLARADLDAVGCRQEDVVVALAASGRTPYAIAGLVEGKARGALTIGMFSNPGARLGEVADIPVLLATGPELLAGSTRMKAGTAQKAALNAFSTGVMIRLGYVHKGLMVEMRPTNAKLKERAVRMVDSLTGAGPDASRAMLEETGGSIKLAVLRLTLGLDAAAAKARLAAAGGILGRALA